MSFFTTITLKINQFWNKRLIPFTHKPWYFMVLFFCTLLDGVIFFIPSDFILVFSVFANPKKSIPYMASYSLGGALCQGTFYWFSLQHSTLLLSYLGTFFDAPATLARATSWLNYWGPMGIVPMGISPVPLQFMMVACGIAKSSWLEVGTYLIIARIMRAVMFVLLAKWGEAKLGSKFNVKTDSSVDRL